MTDVTFKFVRRTTFIGTTFIGALTLAASLLAVPAASRAQVVRAPRYTGGLSTPEAPARQLNMPALPPAITPNGTVVEDVVVRVNDQIISRSDVARAEEALQQDAQQGQLSPADLALKQKDMLRDMIDQALLLSKAKELGLNADADVIRQLDEIRKQNKFDSMDDLERAARQQGVSFEDFKAKIRDQVLTQQVVREEVGRRIQLSQSEEARYYEAHKADFTQPEQIRLSEILVPLAENATPTEVSQAEKKAEAIKTSVMQGANFADLAKKDSGGPSAAQGGELGLFKRGALAKVLEDQTFDLKAGDSTQPIRTRQGFVILKVTEHIQAGAAPMKDVEPQIQEAVYMSQMQPALRAYLTKLREESYVDLQPGFIDAGASAKETKPVFTAYAAPAVKKKKVTTKARFDRRGNATASVRQPAVVVSSPDTTGGRTLTGAEAQTPVDAATGLAVVSAPSKTPTRTASGKKIKREKIRFGQAPRNTLPAGQDEVAVGADTGAVGLRGTTPATQTPVNAADKVQLPASNTLGSLSESSSGAGSDNGSANLADNALNPRPVEQKKTRFSSRAAEIKQKKATTLNAKKQEKINSTPLAETRTEKVTEQTQAAPLGLAGDTSKKPAKAKRVKGGKKERLEDKKKVVVAPVTPDPTASPALAPTSLAPTSRDAAPATQPATQPQTPSNSSAPRAQPDTVNPTTLPPVTQPIPGANPTGQPIPPA